MVFLGISKIPIEPEDQEKTTFALTIRGNFSIPSFAIGWCNAPGTFQRYFFPRVLPISRLKCFKRCETPILALKLGKELHFMVKRWNVLGLRSLEKGIEVDKAKVDVISKLPHPTTVKGIRSFLGHADSIEDLSKTFPKSLDP
ncbi:hypothetical protein Tco_0502579 [Tanacetum coccineum]